MILFGINCITFLNLVSVKYTTVHHHRHKLTIITDIVFLTFLLIYFCIFLFYKAVLQQSLLINVLYKSILPIN